MIYRVYGEDRIGLPDGQIVLASSIPDERFQRQLREKRAALKRDVESAMKLNCPVVKFLEDGR